MSNLSVTCPAVDRQQTFSDSVFPFVYFCDGSPSLEDARSWVAERREQLLAEATQHGAVLFRGFPVNTAEDFDGFISALELPNFPYQQSLSNAVRVNRTERVFTANEAPPEVNIFLHHEMAQTPIFPHYIMFFCEQPAETGGATPICRSDVLLERLAEQQPQFVADCLAKGLRYTNVMPSSNDPQSGMGRSWQSTLGVTTREAAEQRLAELGYQGEWIEGGCLRATTPVLPAIREVGEATGERRTFFNQLIAAFKGWRDTRNDPSKAICHGDGTPLERVAVEQACDLADELSFDVPWQRGDVALLDNFIAMHGRRTFSGTRKVLASLADAHRVG
ncbi:MAG: TauD/TfdA family dioxygenase [Planctomycetales bacterium]|nr:TauD/TfdA family dioxygenase [Planctomycetales bacterium]